MSNTARDATDWLNDIEYRALLTLYHDYNTAFKSLPDYIQAAFFSRLRSTS